MALEWFESFFTPLALDFWRAAVPAATAEEVEFLVRNLGVAPPVHLLDIPSGLGRHAIALAQRGYRVTGVDIAPAAVMAARQESEALGLGNAEFVLADMRKVSLSAKFDGAYCFGNSFSYLSHENTLSFVCKILEMVRPGGRWVIDTGMSAESLLPQLDDERQLEVGGITYSVRNTYDPVAGRLNQACTFRRGSEQEHARTSQGVYTVAELHRLLQSHGWRTLGAFGSLNGKPFALRDRRLILVAQRA
jgi:SAM-dependent methyltransferase